MSNFNKLEFYIDSSFGRFLTEKELFKIGIFPSIHSIRKSRSRRKMPPHFEVNGRIYYLKIDVVDWLKEQYHK